MSDNVVSLSVHDGGKTGRGSGGGPYDPAMEARVTSLEGQCGRIERLLEKVDARTQEIQVRQGESNGRLSGLPTTWQMITLIVGSQFTLAALVGAVLKWLH